MKNNLKYKKMAYQQSLIVVLLVLLTIALSLGTTLAIFGQLAQDRAFVSFAPPVRVHIVDGNLIGGDVISRSLGDFPLMPGDKKKIELGFKLSGRGGEESSSAYVRVKFESSVEMGETGNDLKDFITIESAIYDNPTTKLGWVLVDFNEVDGNQPDLWYLYVIKTDNPNEMTSKIVLNGENGKFLDGEISVDGPKVTYEHAGKSINLNYTVEASQSKNIIDPIESLETYQLENGTTVYKGKWRNH